MFSGLVSTGPFMKTGVGNLKLATICTLGYGLGGFAGAQGAIWFAKQMGVTGEGIIRIVLGIIVFILCLYFLRGGRKREWPEVDKVDSFSARLNLSHPYFEPSLGKVIHYKIGRVGWGLVTMIGIGLISGFFGMGGGWAIVPSLNLVMGIPLKVAAASSSVIIGMGDCITVWPYILAGAMIPLFVAPWLVGQVLGGMVGAQVLIRAGSRAIRYILIGIMFYTSFGLLLNGLIKLEVIDHVNGAVYIAVLIVVLSMTTLAILDKLPGMKSGGNKHG
ncbi:MAG TPA: sulfite exporter TauE/SafE family protein [Dehalococcoidia bacterium]|nr:sulfite exporter TauE/SafE family protein [Dehalococcoidia bacterium]